MIHPELALFFVTAVLVLLSFSLLFRLPVRLLAPPVQSQLQPASPLPSPSPYACPTGGLTERREPASRPASPVRTARTSGRGSRQRPPPVPGTHRMSLRPSTAPLRAPLPSPPTSSLPALADPESDSLCAASPTVTRLLTTAVTDPSFESSAASALVTGLVDFAARCRLDYATSLVAESESACSPSVGGECALGTDVLEDRQEEFQCLAADSPHLASVLLAPEGDPDALDIPTPRSYVDAVPPPGANIVSGMWIFRVKRPPGSPPVFKARYVARGFSQRQRVDYFQTFSPNPKMTTLRVLLHVPSHRDYELHSLDFSTAFLQGSLHEEIWLRRPPGFTGSFPPGTQWSLRRPVYGLRQAPREWHDTLRTTLAALGFAPSTADPSLFLRTDTSLPPFYILVYVDDLVFATADTAGLAYVKSELQKRHTCTDLATAATATATTTAATADSAAPACCTSMASLRVLAFDQEGRPVQFDTWLNHLQLYILSDIKDGVSLFDHVSGAATAPPTTADGATRSQTAQALYDAVVARYSSPATAALGRLVLPYLFPELSAFAIVKDLVSHLRASDARYRAAVPAEFLDKNQPPMFITLYFIVTRLPDSLRSVRDHFLSLDPTSLTFDLHEQHLLAAETSAVAVGAARGTPRPPFFEGCSPSPLAPSYTSSAAADVSVAEDVGAASASAKRHSSKGAREVEVGAAVVEVAAAVVEVAAGVVVGAAAEVVAAVGLAEGVGALVAAVEAAVGVAAVAAVGLVVVGLELGVLVQEVASANSSSVGARPSRPSSFTCGRLHTQHRCFSRPEDAWRAEFGDDVKLPRWADLLRSRIAIFDLEFDAILSAMYALSVLVSLVLSLVLRLLRRCTPSRWTHALLLVSFVTSPLSLLSLQLSRSDWLTPLGARSWVRAGGSESCPYVIRRGVRAGQTCGTAEHRCFSRLDVAWRAEFGDDVERPRWADFLRSGDDIFDLNYDAILSAMYALCASAEGDCYRCVPPDPGIATAALGASESGTPLGTAPAEALHTFTLDSRASRCFFRDSTTLTPLCAPVSVRLADPSEGPVMARSSTVLPCPAVPSGSLSGLHLPSFSTNLVSTAALQDAIVTTTTPGGQRVTICTCTRTGRHLAMFTRRPWSSLYTLATEPPQVAASVQVSASGQVAASCSCRLLSHQTLLWHHRLGHPSLPCLRGMHSHLLVSGLRARSLPPLSPSPALPCLPCVEGRKCAAPHSSSFPPTTAPLQTLHMDVWGPACVSGQSRERYFLLVVDDYTRYTTVFPLRKKGKVVDVLIPWICTDRLQLHEQFGQDLPVLRLHSGRGGEFSFNLLREFRRGKGILQSFTLPDSPQQNGIAERHIGLVMEVARTSMIHASAPHFLWPFAVRYTAHQLNLWPHVSLPEISPTLRWTGKVGDLRPVRLPSRRALYPSSSVLSSSCEAEIYAGAMAALELRWLTYLLTDLREPPRSPPVLYVDNKAMLALCREHRLEHRTKHVALRYFLARELQQRGQLRLAYMASQANTADIFTKALQPCDHQRFCTMLACFALFCLTGLVTPSSPPLCLWGPATALAAAATALAVAATALAAAATALAAAATALAAAATAPAAAATALAAAATALAAAATVLAAAAPALSAVLRAPRALQPCTPRAPCCLVRPVRPAALCTRICSPMRSPYPAPLPPFLLPLPAARAAVGVRGGGGEGRFYHPTSRRVFPSQDVTFDELVPFYRLLPYRSAPPPPPPLFLAPGPPPVDPLPPQGPAPSGVSQVDPLPGPAPVQVAVGSGAARGVASGGAASRGARPRGAESEGAETGGAEPGGVEPGGGEPGGTEHEGVEPGGAGPEGAESGGAEPGGTGAAGTGGVEGARAGDPTESGGTGAGGSGAGGAGAGGAGVGGTGAGGAGVGGPGVGGSGAGGAGAVGPGGAPQLQPASPLPAPSPYTEQSSGLTERREPASLPVSPVRTACCVPRTRPPPVPGTHAMTLRPSSIPLRVPLPAPLESSLPEVLDLESDRARVASPTVSCLLATAVTDPSFEYAAASALVAELLDFAAACRLDYATALVAESASASPPSVGGECALGTDVLEDWQLLYLVLLPCYLPLTETQMHQTSDPALLRTYVDKWHNTLRTTLAALGFSPATADPSLFLRTDTSLPPFYVLVYVDDLVFATADTEALTLLKSELHKRHTCIYLGELRSYLGLQIIRDRAWCTITLTQSHMVHQVLQRFGFHFSSPQPTPLSTGHSLSAPPSDESVEPSGPHPELVGCLMYLMTCTRPDLAYPLILLARSCPHRSRRRFLG
ncbi:unnamed protein product [Closterium sp. NIES-53]